VFLVSGVFGSIFSVLLYPHSTSVGASGGLMGLLGFIAVAAYFNRKTYPPKYLRNAIEAIVMIGVFGLLGFEFIDNAAHFGGLCGGLLLGWLLLRPYNQKSDEANPPEKSGKLAAAMGVVALIILGLGAALAVVRILGLPENFV
jgi:membrane associated rhomboid family serine protease